jgi:hypothetical protein
LKLFQIEEPDGSPVDPDAPGVAVGVDIAGPQAEVAIAVGGNAILLEDREGLPLELAVPPATASPEQWQELFEGVRLRAERALAQPVTHAVLAVASPPEPALAARMMTAGEAAGLNLVRFVLRDEIAASEPAALTAACIAEDLAPRAGPA